MITDAMRRDMFEAEKADRELRDHMNVLLKHPSFEVYLALLNRRIEKLGGELVEPLRAELFADSRQEHLKGTMYGLILARDLPAATVALVSAAPEETDDVSDE